MNSNIIINMSANVVCRNKFYEIGGRVL